MIQKINLLNAIPKKIVDYYGSEYLVKYFGGFIAIVLLTVLYFWWGNYSIELDIAELQKENKQVTTLIAKSKKQPAFINMVKTEKDITLIDKKINIQKQLIEVMSDNTKFNTTGFSQYMKAFSDTIVDGIWLTEIKIDKGGKYFYLTGKTTSSVWASVFIEKLEDLSIFKGINFKIKNIKEGADDLSYFSIEGEHLK